MTDDSTQPRILDPGAARWRKSTFSGYQECVEVAEFHDQVAVRNSNNPDAGTLLLGRADMAAWLAGIKAGEFDDLIA